MKIIVGSMYFYPDHSGISVYATDFASYMADRGHKVTVVTGFPFYPSWQKRRGDVGKLFRSETWRGIRILRGYLYVPAVQATLRRILSEISFIAFALANFVRAGRNDAIVVFTTPISLGAVGVIMGLIGKAKVVVNVQDLQLDAALSLRMMDNGIVVRLLRAIEKWSYSHATTVFSISPQMVKLISERNSDKTTVDLWPNWIDVGSAMEKGRNSSDFLSRCPHFAKSKTIVYAGNIGLKQGLEILVDIAKAMEDYKGLTIYIIGEGAALHRLREHANKSGVTNVEFLPMLREQEYYEMLETADLIFVSQKEAGDYYFPSKLLGVLAKSKVLIVAAHPESELYRVVSEFQIGFVAKYGQVDKIVEFARAYLDNPETAERFKRNAVNFVMQYDREKILSTLERKLTDLGS